MKERSRDTFFEELSDDDLDDVNGGVDISPVSADSFCDNFYLAAGNGALQGALEAILQKGAAARGPAGKLEVAVIDGTDLDGDAAAVQKLLIPSVAGHTAYHGKTLTFQMK